MAVTARRARIVPVLQSYLPGDARIPI